MTYRLKPVYALSTSASFLACNSGSRPLLWNFSTALLLKSLSDQGLNQTRHMRMGQRALQSSTGNTTTQARQIACLTSTCNRALQRNPCRKNYILAYYHPCTHVEESYGVCLCVCLSGTKHTRYLLWFYNLDFQKQFGSYGMKI